MNENGARSIERDCQQVARHRVPGRPNLEHETVAAAGKGRGQHSNDRFYQSTVMQTEGEYVGRWRWNRGAAGALKRADDVMIAIT